MKEKDFVSVLEGSDGFRALKGVTQEEVLKAEKTLEVVFASEYKDYLIKYGVATIKGHEFTGLGSSARLSVIDNTIQERSIHPDLEKKYYVVEQCNYEGFVVLQSADGKVYLLKPNMNIEFVAESLATYISDTI